MKSLNVTEGKITGTPKQLAGRICLTGPSGESVVLQQPDISFLTRMGLATPVGTEKKATEGRGGKPSTIWQFDTKKIGFQIEQLARKQSPGKRAAKAIEDGSEASNKARKNADRKVAAKNAAPADNAAPKRRGRPAKASNGASNIDTKSLATAISSAVVNVLEHQLVA